jgi:hypothetical protein
MSDRMDMRVIGGGPFAPPRLPFEPHFRAANDRKAVRLRDEHDLERIAGRGGDFARARRIKTWVRKLWNHGYDQLTTSWDALNFIAAARKGKSFSCGSYSFTFVQCCLAMGLPARRVIIKRAAAGFPYQCPGNSAHVTAEVYCRELGDWVVLDPNINAHYRYRDKPISALEIHQRWHRNRGRGIVQHRDKPDFVVPEGHEAMFADFGHLDTKPYYHNVYTSTANGLLPTAANVELCYAGILPYPPALDYEPNVAAQGLQCMMVARDDQFNWPLQQTFVSAVTTRSNSARDVELRFEHNMPFFDHYEWSVGGKRFRRCKDERPRLRLAMGRTKVKVRGVDCFARPGHEASMTFEVTKLPGA